MSADSADGPAFGVQLGVGVAGRVATTTIAFAGAVVLARELGPAGYGAFYLLLAVVAVLDNPVGGWVAACRKRLRESGFPADEAVGAGLLAVAVASAVVALAALALRPVVRSFVGVPDSTLLLVVMFVAGAAYLAATELLAGSERFGATDWLHAGRDLVRVGVQLALVFSGYGVAGMVAGMAAANLVVAPVAVALLGVRPALPTSGTLRSVGAFARSSVPDGVVGTAADRLDALLLGALVGPGVVGEYEIALRVTMPAVFVAGVASGGLVGRVAANRSEGRPVATDVRNTLAYASLLAVPLFFGALVVGTPVVVTAFSAQFAGAGAFVAGLALFRLLATQKVTLGATLNGLDRPELNLRVSTAVLVVNLALGVGLLLAVGPVGVVVATVVSETLGYAARAWLVRSLLPDVSLLPRPLAEQLFAGAVMAVVVAGVREFVALDGWPVVLAVVAAGGAVYFVTLTALSREFRATVRAVARDAGR